MLALVAGQGALPTELAAAEPCFVAALEGFPPDDLVPDETFRIEHLGSFLAGLSARGIDAVCLAGAIRRPPIDPGAVDAATMPLVPRLAAVMGQGDDALLRTVIRLFEEAGLSVRGAHEVAPSLLPEPGVLTPVTPEAHHQSDLDRAVDIVAALGAADIGQACVVHRGQAIALEGLFGTDWMLRSLKTRPDGTGGLLCKAPKPGQDRRVDLPTIGPDTVLAAAEAGLDGIVIEAGGVLMLARARTLALAEEHGLFLWVREP